MYLPGHGPKHTNYCPKLISNLAKEHKAFVNFELYLFSKVIHIIDKHARNDINKFWRYQLRPPTLLRICLSPYLKMKNRACSHCSVFKQIRYEYDEVFTLLLTDTMLLIRFPDKFFRWKNTVVFECIRIWCTHWKRSVFNTYRIRKYAYLFAY